MYGGIASHTDTMSEFILISLRNIFKLNQKLQFQFDLALPAVELQELMQEVGDKLSIGPFNIMKFLSEKVSIVLQSDVTLILGIV